MAFLMESSQGEEGLLRSGQPGQWTVVHGEGSDLCWGQGWSFHRRSDDGRGFGVSGSRCPTSQIFLGAQENFQ